MWYNRSRKKIYLPMAQLDSASDSDSEGQRFESAWAGQKFDKLRLVEFFIHCESNGISSRVSVYIIRFDEYISPKRVYHQPQVVSLSQWWYTMLRIDDIPQKIADDIHAFGVNGTRGCWKFLNYLANMI